MRDSRTHIIGWRWLIPAFAILTSAALAADYSGTVVNPDGKPVAGATVYLVPLNVDQFPSTQSNPPTTRTDANGQFNFHRDAKDPMEFIARADGYGLVSRDGSDADNVMYLPPRTDLQLKFLTFDEKPAAFVAVALKNVSYSSGVGAAEPLPDIHFPRAWHSVFAATTDSNGNCTIPGLPQGAQASLRILDDRFARLAGSDDITLSNAPITTAPPIHLLPAATLSGRVTYGATRPAAGISVHAVSDDSSADVLTDADGRYTLKQMRPARYTVTADLDDAAQKSWTDVALVGVTIDQGHAKTDADLQLIPGEILTGKAVAADDGKPVPGVQFKISGPAHPNENGGASTVTTGADGTFSLRVPTGDQFISFVSRVAAPGFLRQNENQKVVGPGFVEFRLPRANTPVVRGQVVDPDGNAVPGASIFISSDAVRLYENITCRCGPDGTFQTPPIVARTTIELRARFHDLATIHPTVVNLAVAGSAVVVHLQKDSLASFSGKIIDPKGQPVPNAQIEVLTRMGNNGFWQSVCKTDNQGNYNIPWLWADGVYTVDASGDGWGEADSPPLHGRPGGNIDVADLTLFKLDSSVAGVLLDGDNKPVANQYMEIVGPRTGYQDINTDSQGKFHQGVVSKDQLTVYIPLGRQRITRMIRWGDQNIILHTVAPKIPIAQNSPAAPTLSAAVSQVSSPVLDMPQSDPAAFVTWRGWLYAGIMLFVGSALTIVANIISALFRRAPKS
jgi:protocatechuate 3,4-dioxygenase beta subunit